MASKNPSFLTEKEKARIAALQRHFGDDIGQDLPNAVARALAYAYPENRAEPSDGPQLIDQKGKKADEVPVEQEPLRPETFSRHEFETSVPITRKDYYRGKEGLVGVNEVIGSEEVTGVEWHDRDGHRVMDRIENTVRVYDREGNVAASIALDREVPLNDESYWKVQLDQPFVASITYYAPEYTVELDGKPDRTTQKTRSRQDKAMQEFKAALRNGPTDEDDMGAPLLAYGEAGKEQGVTQPADHLGESRQGVRNPDHSISVSVPMRVAKVEEFRQPTHRQVDNDLDARLTTVTQYHANRALTTTRFMGDKGKQVEHFDKDGNGKRTSYDKNGAVIDEAPLQKRKTKRTVEAHLVAAATSDGTNRPHRDDKRQELLAQAHQADIDDARAHLPETIKAEEKRQREVERQIEARKESQTNRMWDKRQIELNTYPQEPDDGSQTPDVQVQREKRDRTDHRFVPEETREDRRSQIEAKLHQQETQAEADGTATEASSKLGYQAPAHQDRAAYSKASRASRKANRDEQWFSNMVAQAGGPTLEEMHERDTIATQTDQMWAERKAELEQEAKAAQHYSANGIASAPRNGKTQRAELEEPAAKGFDGRHRLRARIHQREIDHHRNGHAHDGNAHTGNGHAHSNEASRAEIDGYEQDRRAAEAESRKNSMLFTDRIIDGLELAQSRNGNGKKGREDR